jgi:hypothetical protein
MTTEIILLYVALYAATSVAGYFVGMAAFRTGYPKWFNDQKYAEDRGFCLQMSLLGPLNLIVAIVAYFRRLNK